jgi:uncharacterized protein YjbI with pentapeptide repeats
MSGLRKLTATELRDSYGLGQREFCGVDLRSLNLSEFDLSGVEFVDALLGRCNLNFARFQGASFGGVGFDHAMAWRADFRWAKLVDCCGDRSVLVRADLSQSICSRVSLRFADLRLANLKSADLRWADLTGANLSYADLCGADLTGANLSGANLTAANLMGVVFDHANLSHAQLERVQVDRRAGIKFSWKGLVVDQCSDSNLIAAGIERSIVSRDRESVLSASLSGGDARSQGGG